MSILMRFKSDASLSADFERLLAEMRLSSHANPRTQATIAKAKSIGLKLKIITDEMQQRSGKQTNNIAISDTIIGEINAVTGSVSDTLNTATNKVLIGLAMVGFIVFQYKK